MRNYQHGIGRLELVVMITISIVVFIYFQVVSSEISLNSRHSEAKVMVGLIEQLYSSVSESRSVEDLTRGFQNKQRAFSGWFYFLTKDDFSSEKSCNLDNPLGFTVKNCLKQHYQYHLLRTEGTDSAPCTSGFCAAAVEGGYFSSSGNAERFRDHRRVHNGCKDIFADLVAKDMNSKSWIIKTPSC